MAGGTCTYGFPKDLWEPLRKNLNSKKEQQKAVNKKPFNRKEAERKAFIYHADKEIEEGEKARKIKRKRKKELKKNETLTTYI